MAAKSKPAAKAVPKTSKPRAAAPSLDRVALAGRLGTIRHRPESSDCVDVEFDDEPGVVATVRAAQLLEV